MPANDPTEPLHMDAIRAMGLTEEYEALPNQTSIDRYVRSQFAIVAQYVADYRGLLNASSHDDTIPAEHVTTR